MKDPYDRLDKQTIDRELQELTEQVLLLQSQLSGSYDNTNLLSDTSYYNGEDYELEGYDEIDEEQDARLTRLEDSLEALIEQVWQQQRQAVSYFNTSKGDRRDYRTESDNLIICSIPKTIRCRGWSAVEVNRTNQGASLSPLYVLGEVNNGPVAVKLVPASTQGRDSSCLTLDLREDTKRKPAYTGGLGYQTVRYDEKIARDKYKKVQVNWQGRQLALFDVIDTKFPGTSHRELPAGPDLQCGSTGERVRTLQRILVSIGYIIKVDGDFGTETEEAVKNFQEAEDLKVDGIVGPITRSHINKIDEQWQPNGKLFGGKMFWQ